MPKMGNDHSKLTRVAPSPNCQCQNVLQNSWHISPVSHRISPLSLFLCKIAVSIFPPIVAAGLEYVASTTHSFIIYVQRFLRVSLSDHPSFVVYFSLRELYWGQCAGSEWFVNYSCQRMMHFFLLIPTYLYATRWVMIMQTTFFWPLLLFCAVL